MSREMKHMKRRSLAVVSLAAFLALPVAAGFAQDGANLIKNPSFEEKGSPDYGAIAAWKGYIRGDKNVPGVKAFFTQSSDSQDGKASARIEAPQDQPRSNALAEWWQQVPITPGKRYYFSVYQRGAPVKCWAAVAIEEKVTGSQLAKGTPEFPAGHVAKAPDGGGQIDPENWQLLETTFTAGPETKILQISLRLQSIGGGWVEYDNAKLIELPPQNP